MTAAPEVLLIGHITADLTPTGRQMGGTVSYAARVLAAFGMRAAVLTSAAPDDPLLEGLRPYVDQLVVLPAAQTSTFENIYGPNGRVQYIRGVAAPIGPEDVPPDWLAAPFVHLAPLTDEVSPRIAHLFPHATVMLTLQGWLRRWDADGRVWFKRWFDPDILRSVDIVVFSEEDILDAPELEPEFAGAVPHLFVTRAERGGTHYHQGEPHPYTTPQVTQIHPTGAGDIFAAALLASLPRVHQDYRAATRIAARLAATSVTRIGLDSAPTADEVRQALLEG